MSMAALHLDQTMIVNGKSGDWVYGEVADEDCEGRDCEKVEELGERHVASEMRMRV